jgi:hypothetical protein
LFLSYFAVSLPPCSQRKSGKEIPILLSQTYPQHNNNQNEKEDARSSFVIVESVS